MSIIGKLNNFKIKVFNKSSYKPYTTDEVLDYINSFPEPVDYMERSYFQYLCNSKLYGVKKSVSFIRNLACFFPFWFLLLRKGVSGVAESCDHVFISDEYKMNIIPAKYKESFQQVRRSQGWLLGKQERRIVSELWEKHPFSYYFLLKNLIKLANYKWAIETYKPKDILCSCEYSFTSSVLTEYCRTCHLKHINLMHGFNIVDLKCPFSTFDVMSIWDDFFIDAYKTMRCGTTDFEIEKPDCVKLNKYEVVNEKPVLKYYTQNYPKKIVPVLRRLVKTAEENGMKLEIRCHPSYPFEKEDAAGFPDSTFEDNRKIDIERSINGADYVIARNSTVLYQAALLDKRILIDDVSLPEEYIESRKKGAFLWETERTDLLSSFLEDPERFKPSR